MKKRFIAILLAAVVLVTLPAALVAAKETTTHEINFNLDGTYKTYNFFLDTTANTTSTANANIGGELREKNGNWYLSPLRGSITIDSVPHQIVVTQLNQSQRVNYKEYSSYYSKQQYWFCCVEVNIEGDKYAGGLWFRVNSKKNGGQPIPISGQSRFYFEGNIDGKVARFYMPIIGPMPEIE